MFRFAFEQAEGKSLFRRRIYFQLYVSFWFFSFDCCLYHLYLSSKLLFNGYFLRQSLMMIFDCLTQVTANFLDYLKMSFLILKQTFQSWTFLLLRKYYGFIIDTSFLEFTMKNVHLIAWFLRWFTGKEHYFCFESPRKANVTKNLMANHSYYFNQLHCLILSIIATFESFVKSILQKVWNGFLVVDLNLIYDSDCFVLYERFFKYVKGNEINPNFITPFR